MVLFSCGCIYCRMLPCSVMPCVCIWCLRQMWCLVIVYNVVCCLALYLRSLTVSIANDLMPCRVYLCRLLLINCVCVCVVGWMNQGSWSRYRNKILQWRGLQLPLRCCHFLATHGLVTFSHDPYTTCMHQSREWEWKPCRMQQSLHTLVV